MTLFYYLNIIYDYTKHINGVERLRITTNNSFILFDNELGTFALV